jgi:hypothetical protein
VIEPVAPEQVVETGAHPVDAFFTRFAIGGTTQSGPKHGVAVTEYWISPTAITTMAP